MTVASLWKALDRAGCGKPVGVQEILDHHGLAKQQHARTNPWNYNRMAASKMPQHPPTLAIDLSIWICESLNSSVMAENHADPTMHLVFTRTIKLLHLGIKLIGVIEGKKRRLGLCEGEKKQDEFQKRRGGTQFWRACEKCESMLEMLGVPVVRAKAEGEALCALLNDKGIVDGVISNDGDCFLFGAKVLYTKFSIENLNQGKVMRYDADSLVACLDDDDHDEYDRKAQLDSSSPLDIVTLNRSDLVVFAIITGSDMAGSGISNVGCRKALRFIRKCQIDNPLRSKTAAYDELVSWSRAAKGICETLEPHHDQVKCSSCHHGGTKAQHFKHGCEICGTSPGESCFLVSPGGKFRQSLRNKALAMNPKFDPESVSNAYHNPNDNQVPVQFVGLRSQDVLMETPDLHRFVESPWIVRGRSSAESRSYVLQSLSQLMARTELSHLYESSRTRENRPRNKVPRSNKNKPFPLKIVKEVTRSSLPCFQVLWKVSATTTDSKGYPIDEYEFSTIEDQIIVKKCFPDIVEKFSMEEKERVKQGNAEQERRRAFLDVIKTKLHQESKAPVIGETLKLGRRKREFFQKRDHHVCLRGDRWIGTHVSLGQGHHQGTKGVHISRRLSDDAAMLFHASAPLPYQRQVDFENGSMVTISTLSCATSHMHPNGDSEDNCPSDHHSDFSNVESPYKINLSPSHLYFLSSALPAFKASDDVLETNESRLADAHFGEHRKWSSRTFSERQDDVVPSQPQFQARPSNLKLMDSPSIAFGLSPCLKRSRFSNGPRIAPPTSPGNYMPYVDRIEKDVVTTLRANLEKEVFHQYDPLNETTPSTSIHNLDARTGGRNNRRFSTITNVEFAKEVEKMLTSTDFNDSWLVESFAGFSIHSIHSPRTKTVVSRPRSILSPSPSKWIDIVEPTTRVSPMQSRHQTWIQSQDHVPSSSKCDNREHRTSANGASSATIGESVLEAAMAKWASRSRSAKLEKENLAFLQEELLQDSFDWL